MLAPSQPAAASCRLLQPSWHGPFPRRELPPRRFPVALSKIPNAPPLSADWGVLIGIGFVAWPLFDFNSLAIIPLIKILAPATPLRHRWSPSPGFHFPRFLAEYTFENRQPISRPRLVVRNGNSGLVESHFLEGESGVALLPVGRFTTKWQPFDAKGTFRPNPQQQRNYLSGSNFH